MKAPFPWFGGKSRCAPAIWDALGDVNHYIEPFAGSLAVLLARPTHHAGPIETVNDADGYVVNAWRAIKLQPEQTAQFADWPVTELDLDARHAWLVEQRADLADRLAGDPTWCDPRIAGWWLWGISAWIGGGWCSGTGPGRRVEINPGDVQLRPDQGRPGISRRVPRIGAPQGVHRRSARPLPAYFARLSDRLRRVTVCCGDWSRVLTEGATAHGTTIGILLDPPYDSTLRDPDCYSTDSAGLSANVRLWAIANGHDHRLRIALCGYADEHDMPSCWRIHRWDGTVGYSRNNNHRRETIWFSPACNDDRQTKLSFAPARRPADPAPAEAAAPGPDA